MSRQLVRHARHDNLKAAIVHYGDELVIYDLWTQSQSGEWNVHEKNRSRKREDFIKDWEI